MSCQTRVLSTDDGRMMKERHIIKCSKEPIGTLLSPFLSEMPYLNMLSILQLRQKLTAEK